MQPMTKVRLEILGEAFRRESRRREGVPDGMGAGVGCMSDFVPVLVAGWVCPRGEIIPRTPGWFDLTAWGWKIVERMFAAGLSYKHIEAAKNMREIFDDPDAFVLQFAARGVTLPPLNAEKLQKAIKPRGGVKLRREL